MDSDRVHSNYKRGRIASENRDDPELGRWVQRLGVKLIDVFFIVNGQQHLEPQVDDPVTLDQTISMAMGRLGATAVVYPYNGRWTYQRRGKLARYVDSREAAEMLAIHGA